jgi:hypothetical protein
MKATSCPLLSKTPLGAKCCALLETFFRKFGLRCGLSVNRSVGGITSRAFAEWQRETSLPESGL